MSTGHENVIWQSADGTWNRGFYASDYGYWGEEDEEPEAEYDQTAFEWVSRGHASEQDAHNSWRGANPGHSYIIRQPQTDQERAHWDGEHDRLDDMAAQLFMRDPGVATGTPRRRVPRFLARDIATALSDSAHYALGGYANQPTDVTGEMAELRSRIPDLTAAERAQVSAELAAGADRITSELTGTSLGWTVRGRFPEGSTDAAAKLRDALNLLRGDVQRAAPASAKGTPRAKTTPQSTPGSFAPKEHSAPDVTIG